MASSIAAVMATDQRRRDVDVSHDADRVDAGPRRIHREAQGVQQPARRLRRNSDQDRSKSPREFSLISCRVVAWHFGLVVSALVTDNDLPRHSTLGPVSRLLG